MITVQTNATQLRQALKSVSVMHRNAFVRAINGLAYDIRDEEVREMKRVFDRPTPYVLNALRVDRANSNKIRSRVWFRDSDSDYNYMLPQVFGGDRRQKKFEYRLYKIGLLKKHEVLIPATKAGAVKLDRYGNPSRGQIVQILSQLQGFGDAGFSANETSSTKNKRSRQKRTISRTVQYFFARNTEEMETTDGLMKGARRQHLKSGIWARYKSAWGTAVKPVFFVADQANYEKRFRFFDIAKKTIDFRYKFQMRKAYLIEKRKFFSRF